MKAEWPHLSSLLQIWAATSFTIRWHLLIKGVARKTRLVRHGVFDWRKAIFGPYPIEKFNTLPDAEKEGPERRISPHDMMVHYEPICAAQRRLNCIEPYESFARSYQAWTTYEMSDYFPIWIELKIDYSNDYIKRFIRQDLDLVDYLYVR